jgi:hypothetical protein
MFARNPSLSIHARQRRQRTPLPCQRNSRRSASNFAINSSTEKRVTMPELSAILTFIEIIP